MTRRTRQRPEALAQFAETARDNRRQERPGLVADEATAPRSVNPADKDKAATKVLQEGVTGTDRAAKEAIDKLPDRIIESRHAYPGSREEGPEDDGIELTSYDATTDPRTGRPPLPKHAAELTREHELERLRNAQLAEGEDEADPDEADIEVMLEDDKEPLESALADEQAPGRMTSPRSSHDGGAGEN